MIFRIDDVSVNTDIPRLQGLLALINSIMPGEKIMLAVSPLVHHMPRNLPALERERAFPRILSAMSDHRKFFEVKHLGMPITQSSPLIQIASHGLVHADHRLMGREAQELSIVTSCSLVGARVFVPPFNKWNAHTEEICDEHAIELVKFEDGWRHVNYNKFDPTHERYYCHTHDVTHESLAAWFGVELPKPVPAPAPAEVMTPHARHPHHRPPVAP